MNAIDIQRLSKSFGRVRALDAVSFSVGKGELFGLIGPDGAGKTTLFRLLTTLLTPDSGTATVDGSDIVNDYLSIRSRVGYMPGRFSLYPDLTVEENLEFFAALFGVNGKLSGGMKQKLALSCALIHRPGLLFLDEPTTGVDAVSRSEFWDMLASLKQNGITILVSTPYMDEASRCDRIALCNEGRILGIDTPDGIVRRFDAPLYAVRASNMYALLSAARRAEGVAECYPFGEVHHLVAGGGFDIRQFMDQLNELDGLSIKPAAPTIEDVFIKLMKR